MITAIYVRKVHRAERLRRGEELTVAIWLMNGPAIVTIGLVADVPTDWVPR